MPTEQQSKTESLQLFNEQDYNDILSLIMSAPIQFKDAERAVEIKNKLEHNYLILKNNGNIR
jgi:hypothetical protein